MLKSVLAFGTIAFVTVGGAASASAHDAPQVRHELRERGYYRIQFLVNRAPFQVNACRYGDRYHLHVDWYGRVTERVRIGECQGQGWPRNWRRPFRGYRYNR